MPERLFWYYDCFKELSRDRRYEQGHPLPLTTSDIHAYWSAFRMLDFDGFYDTMTLIDRAWLSEVAKRNKIDAEKSKSKPKPALKPSRRR